MSSILTVSQLNRYVGYKIKQDVKLHGVAVSGEITDLSVYYKSGHMYFTITDGECNVKAVMFSSNADKLRFVPENGMKIVAFGNVDLYERDGNYQINVSDMQPMGTGSNRLNLETLKKKIADLGVFNADIKRPIPKRPDEIAVVTSAAGAALQDIINVISRRCPVCRLTVYPCSVQGVQAQDEIEKALFKAGRSTADVVILARGGGSTEDLSAFNTEKVVMAVYDCSIPVISAVGHETDTTLADYAADMRAPTPSAAAELAVPDLSIIYGDIERLNHYVHNLALRCIDSKADRFDLLSQRLLSCSPKNRILSKEDKLDNLSVRLDKAFSQKISSLDIELMKSASKLSALSPFNVLDRGYSLVTKEGKIVRYSKELNKGDEIKIRFSDGEVNASVL